MDQLKLDRNQSIDKGRRMILGAAALGAATAPFVLAGGASAHGAAAPAARASRTAAASPFGPLKRVRAGMLDVAYAEAGPAKGPAVVLLHGWPYDIHSYAEVAPLLAAAGFRVIVPYLRGYGAYALRLGRHAA